MQNLPRAPQIMLLKFTLTILCSLAVIFSSTAASAQASGREESKDPEIQRILTELESDDDNQERDADVSLRRLGEKAALPLIEVMKSTEDERTLASALEALEIVGKDAVPALIDALRVEFPRGNPVILRRISNSLSLISHKVKDRAPALQDAIRLLMDIIKRGLDKHKAAIERFQTTTTPLTKDDIAEINNNLQDFDAAAQALGEIGRPSKDAVPLLLDVLVRERRRKECYPKSEAIGLILDDLINKSDFSANNIIINSFEQRKGELREKDRREIGDRINALKEAEDYSLQKIYTGHRDLFNTLAPILLVLLIWLLIFLLKPVWLLKIYDVFPSSEARLSGVRGTLTVATHYLLGLWVFRPRVLDAWVKRHLATARLNFSSKQTVKDRPVYVPVGLFLNDEPIPKLSPMDLRETFARNQSRLLISGAGGAGKTTLACQIAKWAMKAEPDDRIWPAHAMIPILLEHDFVETGDDALRKEILAQCCDLIDANVPISHALLQALLAQKRLLLLVDGMSEMNEETRNAILSGITRIPTNAVIFTSRSDETISELNKTVIKPTTIKGNQLSTFAEAYLNSLGKKELFEDKEFFEGCTLLSTLVNDRDITVLLAKLFIEQMVAKQEETIAEDLPKNIPQLMLQSIKVLHAKTPSSTLALRDVIKSAKVIAWECLKKDYRPLSADYEEVRKAVADLPDGERSLNYLIDKLKLIETTLFEEKIRFKIDPLAEYLSSMHLVEENRDNKNKWRKFSNIASIKLRSRENICGFLLAVHDCCQAEGLPDFVIEELMKLIRIAEQEEACNSE